MLHHLRNVSLRSSSLVRPLLTRADIARRYHNSLPVAFHLKLFGREISATERIFNWVLIVVCSLLSITGTVFAFLPKELIGAE